MKKKLFILFLIIILGGSIMIISGCSNKENSILKSQKDQIKMFYSYKKESLIKIKNFFWKDKIDLNSINSDGYIILNNSEKIWSPEISQDICDLIKDGEAYNVRNIYYENGTDVKKFSLESYFPENEVIITIVYSEKDLTLSSNMYENLDSNWYLFTAGMT